MPLTELKGQRSNLYAGYLTRLLNGGEPRVTLVYATEYKCLDAYQLFIKSDSSFYEKITHLRAQIVLTYPRTEMKIWIDVITKQWVNVSPYYSA